MKITTERDHMRHALVITVRVADDELAALAPGAAAEISELGQAITQLPLHEIVRWLGIASRLTALELRADKRIIDPLGPPWAAPLDRWNNWIASIKSRRRIR